MKYEVQFLLALLLTVVSELAMGLTVRHFIIKRPVVVTTGRFVVVVCVASCMTLPYVWFVWPYFLRENTLYILVSELWVFIMEACWYRFSLSISWRHALVFSFLLNLFSVIVGKMVMG